jgi:capsular polysaccharide transport system ATP-binding protein
VLRDEVDMILFEGVSKTYHIRKFRKDVLKNINFRIDRGQSVGICGANGAGKSTLMRRSPALRMPRREGSRDS